MNTEQRPINGDADALLIDRAVGELRRGRTIGIVDGDRCLYLAAVEALHAPALERMAGAGERLGLFLTHERGHAIGLAKHALRPVVLSFAEPPELETVRALAGLGGPGLPDTAKLEAADWEDVFGFAAAAFRLAKAGRLLPALLGFEPGVVRDPSILDVPVALVDRQGGVVGQSLKLTSRSRVPLAEAVDSEISLFRDEHGLGEHLAVVVGKPDFGDVVPVRLHSACLTGDLLGSLRCDCGEQLRSAVERIASLGGGVLLYLDQEGRGIGLANKLRAYEIQDTGLDTLDADRHLGFDADERTYDVAAAMLSELGISRIRLLTNNPRKITALEEHGIDVAGRVPLVAPVNLHNERYIRAKQERAGHLVEESGS
jgi:GTP cyclohydrolase II